MNKWVARTILTAVAALALNGVADAATVTVSGKGVVGDMISLGGTATGTVHVGDAMTFAFSYDTGTAIQDTLAADQSSYRVQATGFSAQIGSYTFRLDPVQPVIVSFAYTYAPDTSINGTAFQFAFAGTAAGGIPYDNAVPPLTQSQLSLFGSLSSAPATLEIGSFTDFSHLADGQFQYSVSDDHGGNGGGVIGSVTGSAPEPASWALMLVGFGTVGVGMRRRHAADRQVSFA